MSKQTAVEFYAKGLENLQCNSLEKNDYEIAKQKQRLFEKAKQMEKQQMEDVWDDSRVEDFGDNYIGKQISFNDYYNETFKTKNQ